MTDATALLIILCAFVAILFVGDWLLARLDAWWQQRVDDAMDPEWDR